MKQLFHQHFYNGIDQLITNLNSYASELDIWRIENNIQNSGGNLTLHLIGNLNHFIGAQLGHTGYVRKRDEEFSLKHIERTKLIDMLLQTKTMLEKTFANITDSDLEKIFPLNTFGDDKTTKEVLMVLTGHFSYHLGQINYHRRLLSL